MSLLTLSMDLTIQALSLVETDPVSQQRIPGAKMSRLGVNPLARASSRRPSSRGEGFWTVPAVPGRRHQDLQTDTWLEELEDRREEKEAAVQVYKKKFMKTYFHGISLLTLQGGTAARWYSMNIPSMYLDINIFIHRFCAEHKLFCHTL